MDYYEPPFTITKEMLSLVSSISLKIGQIGPIFNVNLKPHLRRNNQIKSIHSSLKIEANSLTLNQVRDIINGKTIIGPENEIQEVKNAYAAYEKINEIDPYDINCLKKFHGIMTKNLIEESGEFRKGEEGVFDGDTCIFMAPPARFVPNLVNQLFEWMKKSKEDLNPLILGCVFHYEFVFIHPFSNGNGRMARLWHNAILCDWNPIFKYIPLESQIEKFQNEYYLSISECNKQGNSTVFIEFMLAQIDKILDQTSKEMEGDEGQISSNLRKLIDMMEYNTSYSKTELMSKLNLNSAEGFRRNYLQPALKMNLIKMTVPEKPNSRNQRYVKL